MDSSEPHDILSFFPRPIRMLLQGCQSEVHLSVKRIIERLDLVSKEDYLVQRRLLEQAREELKQLKERMASNGRPEA